MVVFVFHYVTHHHEIDEQNHHDYEYPFHSDFLFAELYFFFLILASLFVEDLSMTSDALVIYGDIILAKLFLDKIVHYVPLKCLYEI